jgi:undecaprenyl-diphosphatase
LWYRARPFVEQGFTPLIEHSPSASFPSGHATFFFALGTVLYLYNKKAGALFLLAAAILSAARVAAGLHWQSDIIAGAAIGIVAGVLVVWISRKFL